MKNLLLKYLSSLTVLLLALAAFTFQLPGTCLGADYELIVNASPNIINIESERWGEIRIFTRMSYAKYQLYGAGAFIYFNVNDISECDSIDGIRATRDSWGNLILKFHLEDIRANDCPINPGEYNTIKVVLLLEINEQIYQYSGESHVYIVTKHAQ
ncbi:hypothetical protein ACFL6N_06495 [Thermodesulfobacteriota bacterium]